MMKTKNIMEDLKNLTLHVKFAELHHFLSIYEQRRDFIYKIIWDTFAEAERTETITNRIITLSTELILLQSVVKPFVEQKELDELSQTLQTELDDMRMLRSKTNLNADLRKGTKEDEFERVYNVLSSL